jgi:hypothetical protein
LKYDNCYDDGTKPEVRYPPMRDALNASGRPIFFSMCGMFNMNLLRWLFIYCVIFRMGCRSTCSLGAKCRQQLENYRRYSR